MTHDEVTAWLAAHSLLRMRRSAVPVELLPLWSEAMAQRVGSISDGQAVAKAMAVCFPESRPQRAASTGCPRCGGTGYLRGLSHIHSGRCFACNYSGERP